MVFTEWSLFFVSYKHSLFCTVPAYTGYSNTSCLYNLFIVWQITAQNSMMSFLARLDKVQEELLYYPWRQRWHWRCRRRWS